MLLWIDTFVKMRHYINYNKAFLPYNFLLLEKQLDENTQKINELFDKFDPILLFYKEG